MAAARAKTRRNSDQLRPVLVTWMDHCVHSSGWQDQVDAAKLKGIECQTAGFLVGKDSHAIRVSLNSDQRGQVGDTMVILRKDVKRFKKLK